MITNTGKNIIAKYLIGDTPAYASFIALGCGQKPRPNVTSKSSVSTATTSGTILSTGAPSVDGKFITPITGIASTAGLFVGMTVTKTAGTGAFGAGTTITSIDGPTVITVTSSTAQHTAGTITFSTGGVSQVLSTPSTSGLWIGARVSIIGGTGTFNPNVNTLVTAISSDNRFTVAPGPTLNLLNATLSLDINPEINALDFEMFRVPISSRGYVNDDGTNKIVLTAQLPTEERYEISEVGIYSAGSNAAAGQYDSRTISAFSSEEGWLLSSGNIVTFPQVNSSSFSDQSLTSVINGLNFIANPTPAIKTTTSNGLFSNSTRLERYERTRYLSNVFMLRGDTSYIFSNNENNLEVYGVPAFLQITNQFVDLSKNSSSDILKLAFSIVSVDGNSSAVPDNAKIIIEFSNSDGSQFARMQVEAKDSVYRFANNRYIVVSKTLDELFYTTGQFSWRNVNTVKAYVAITEDIVVTGKEIDSNVATITTESSHGLLQGNYVKISGVDDTFNGVYQVASTPTSTTFTYAKIYAGPSINQQDFLPRGKAEAPSNNFYVALDALRIDNVSTVNPLYGLTGYSIIQNLQEATVVKSPNTNNYIEYRFVLDVT
jgi:hypothetical protein